MGGALLEADGIRTTEAVSVADHAVHRRACCLMSGLVICSIASLGWAACYSTTYPIVLTHSALAFVLGLRHAVDCDHLAAIDNVTRQLVLAGQRPVSVGFWFALGHSTIVVLLTGGLAGGYSTMWKSKSFDAAKDSVVLVAALVSVTLLGGIGLLNARVAVGLFHDWTHLRWHSRWYQDRALEDEAASSLRSALTSVPFLRRFFGRVNRPEKMYVVGFLFGLSFDTATQVGLIAMAAMSGTSGNLPPGMVLCFPLCFSCGMCLVDSGNSILMLVTYSWATVRPMQKLFYNLLITSMSACVALCIGILEMLQIVGREAGLKGGVWTWIQGVNMGTLGCSVMAAFLAVFSTAALCSQATCCCSRETDKDVPQEVLL